MICAAPGLLKPLVILRRQSNTAAGFCENPDAIDNLVRDLEESDCPVDGARAQYPLPQPKNVSGAGAIRAFTKQPEPVHRYRSEKGRFTVMLWAVTMCSNAG